MLKNETKVKLLKFLLHKYNKSRHAGPLVSYSCLYRFKIQTYFIYKHGYYKLCIFLSEDEFYIIVGNMNKVLYKKSIKESVLNAPKKGFNKIRSTIYK